MQVLYEMPQKGGNNVRDHTWSNVSVLESNKEDPANNSLQLECVRGIVSCVNCLPPLVEVLGDNVPFILDGAGGTDISGEARPQITQPAMTHDYFIWS